MILYHIIFAEWDTAFCIQIRVSWSFVGLEESICGRIGIVSYSALSTPFSNKWSILSELQIIRPILSMVFETRSVHLQIYHKINKVSKMFYSTPDCWKIFFLEKVKSVLFEFSQNPRISFPEKMINVYQSVD